MTLITDVFPDIRASNNMVRQMSKKPCFRGPLDREHGKSVETMFQSEWQHLYKIYQSLLSVVASEKVSFRDTQYRKTFC